MATTDSDDDPTSALLAACKAVPRILYGLALDARQALVAQKAIDVCRDAVAKAERGGAEQSCIVGLCTGCGRALTADMNRCSNCGCPFPF